MFFSSWAIKSSHSGALDLIIQLGIGHVIEFKSVSIWKMFVQDKEENHLSRLTSLLVEYLFSWSWPFSPHSCLCR